MLTRHSFVFQIILWNWKHLTSHKVQGKKVFWHVILHIYLCNALCKFFIKIESNWCFSKTWPINTSKEEILLSRDSEELFVQRFVEVFDQNRNHVQVWNQRPVTPADFTVPWQDCQKQPPEFLYKKAILKYFAMSTGNISVAAHF